MRRGDGTPRTGVVLPAFWWTLAAVHMMPLVRLSLAGDAAPASRPLLLLVLGLVIAFCGLAGIVALRAASVPRQARTLMAFLLAASIVHHEAAGSLAPAVLAPVAAVAMRDLAAAIPAVRHRLRRLRQGLQASAIRIIDRLRPSGTAPGPGPRSCDLARPLAAWARGPPVAAA